MSQSLARALHILDELAQAPASLDQLAAAIGVHKTTVLRLLRTLAEQHMVFRDATHRYHLGAHLHELSSQGLDQRVVRGIAAPHLAAFNLSHGRTTHLAELVGSEITYIEKLESHDHVRMASRVGARAPIHATAAGKAIVAALPPIMQDVVISRIDFAPTTPRTITDEATFRAELERVAARGWADDREENEPSINCIGAPVRDASGRPVAAVTVSVPDIVLPYDGLLDLLPGLLEVAERISLDSGWQPPTPIPGGTP